MSFFFARSNRCLHWQAPRALEDPSFSKLSEHERSLTLSVEFAPTPAAPRTRSRTAADCAKISLAVMPIFFSQERADPLYSRSKLTCMLRSILRADGVHGHRPAYYSLLHHLLPAHTANTISRPTLAPSQPIPTVHRVPHSLINHKPHKIALMHRVKIRPAIYLRGSSDSLKSQSRRRMKPLASTLGNLGILHYASSSLSSEFRTVLAAHSTQVLSK